MSNSWVVYNAKTKTRREFETRDAAEAAIAKLKNTKHIFLIHQSVAPVDKTGRPSAAQLVNALDATCERHFGGHMSRSTFTTHMRALWNTIRHHQREADVLALISTRSERTLSILKTGAR